MAALVAAGAYGGIMHAIERQIGYAAVGVGLLVGSRPAKLGGRNPVLPVVSAVLSIGSVYLGQLFSPRSWSPTSTTSASPTCWTRSASAA
ncbi:hypothetical protein ACFSNO_21515 [Streptomyces cirratus]